MSRTHLLLGILGESAVGGDGVQEAIHQGLVRRHTGIIRGYAVLGQRLGQLGGHVCSLGAVLGCGVLVAAVVLPSSSRLRERPQIRSADGLKLRNLASVRRPEIASRHGTTGQKCAMAGSLAAPPAISPVESGWLTFCTNLGQ